MSGWLHQLLVADGVAFSTSPSFNGKITARVPNDSVPNIDFFNTSAPAGSEAVLSLFNTGQLAFSWAGPGQVQLININMKVNGDLEMDATHDILLQPARNLTITAAAVLQLSGATLGFFATTPGTAKATVSGSKGANAALASLMTALAGYGLVTDTTT
jgi:hypothetical protein